MNDDLRSYSLRLLGQRSYSVKGLRKKLLQKEFSPEETDAAIERFIETGLLDDRKFALNFARARLTASSASPRRIRQFLVQKGITGSIADEAIAAVVADEQIDTTATLERVARRKFSTLSNLEPQKARQRLFGFLCRRGYDIEDVRNVIKRCSLEIESAVSLADQS